MVLDYVVIFKFKPLVIMVENFKLYFEIIILIWYVGSWTWGLCQLFDCVLSKVYKCSML